MALTKDLMGLGVPAPLAGKAGHGTLSAALVGVGTDSTAPAPIVSSMTSLAPVSGKTAYILPAAPSVSKEYLFINSAVGADTALIFPPTGGQINNATATTGSFSIAQNKTAIMWEYDGTNKLWAAIVLG